MESYPCILVGIDEHELVPVVGTSNESTSRVHHSHSPNQTQNQCLLCSQRTSTFSHVQRNKGKQNGSEMSLILIVTETKIN